MHTVKSKAITKTVLKLIERFTPSPISRKVKIMGVRYKSSPINPSFRENSI